MSRHGVCAIISGCNHGVIIGHSSSSPLNFSKPMMSVCASLCPLIVDISFYFPSITLDQCLRTVTAHQNPLGEGGGTAVDRAQKRTSNILIITVEETDSILLNACLFSLFPRSRVF